MLTNNLAKFIKSLQIKKYRQKEQCFIVEGEKNILELVKSDYKVDYLLATSDFLDKNKNISQQIAGECIETTEKKLVQLGSFKTNNAALAVVSYAITSNDVSEGIVLMLDDIRDPGNLGTIIRIADWYNIAQIIISKNTADEYNPKVIAASMGSFFRVKISRRSLHEILEDDSRQSFGATLQGENIHKYTFPKQAFIVIGSESHGISTSLKTCLSMEIKIPGYGKAESLNAGVATAIICDNVFRTLKLDS